MHSPDIEEGPNLLGSLYFWVGGAVSLIFWTAFWGWVAGALDAIDKLY